MTAVVIRAWDARHNPVGHALTEFEVDENEQYGVFKLHEDHPLVQVGKQDPWLISFFTVMATESLQWRFISTEITPTKNGNLHTFASRPWITELRRTLQSDQWFVENVIEPAGESSVQP